MLYWLGKIMKDLIMSIYFIRYTKNLISDLINKIDIGPESEQADHLNF